MTPENRARMQAVLNGALRQAYLPGSGHAHVAGHGGAHAASHAPASRTGHELTAAGIPATSIGAEADPEALTNRFCEELEALAGVTYRAKDVHTAADQVVNIVARTEVESGAPGQQERRQHQRGRQRLVLGWNLEEIGVPGLAAALSVRGIILALPEVPFENPDRGESLGAIAELSVGLTGAHAAIAESGSIVLASGPGRGRLASLLTPFHIAILRRDRIVRTLEDLFAQHAELPTLGSNCVIITGPSRTADIEMTLSRGVHGPREIHVIIV